jgi:hypothetical protein
MKANTHSLTAIFGKDVRYLVPLYQRPYVWEQETHWEPLWEDVQTVMDQLVYAEQVAASAPAGAPSISAAPHFLGAIVLDQQMHDTGSLEVRYVIDGQQRLTTLQLFLSAAAQVAHAHACDREGRLLRKLIENDRDLVTASDHLFKVWPTNANRAAFRAAMSDDDGAPDDPANLIQEAHAYFVGALDEWASEEDAGSDKQLRFATLTKVSRELLKIVAIDLEEGDNAQVIFETLNARGTPLLAIDLVKNLVFQRADVPGADLDTLYSNYWEPFDEPSWREEIRQGRLNRPRAEVFLMHWLTMQRAEEVGAHHLFPTFRRLLDDPASPGITDVVREFAADARTFRSFDAQPSGSVEQRFFQRLEILDTTTGLPLALYLFRQPTETLSAERRRRALAVMESWLVRRMLCRLTTKNYNRYFLDLLKAVKADVAHADTVLLETLRAATSDTNLWPTDDAVEDALTTRPFYGQVSQSRVVMTLAAIENAMRTEKSEEITLPAKLTIEHVMPQEWRTTWLVDPPDDLAKIGVRERHLHRLGNLTLVTAKLNPSLSNSPWTTKRPELNKHSVLLLNRRVVDEHPDLWDETAIDNRSVQLADYVKQIWPAPTSSAWTS